MEAIPNKESLTVEFKSDIKGFSETELIYEIIGMTNTEGGTLYLGVEDDGTLTGLNKKHKDPTGLMALVANKTVPSVSVRAEIIKEQGTEVMMIQIPISRAIVASSDGKIQKRRLKPDGSPENVPMYPYEIPNRLSTLNLLDYSAQILEGAGIEDLDANERERQRNIIRYRKGEKYLLELSDDELDKALQLVKEENGTIHPTVTGILLLGKEDRIAELMPTAKAAFQVFEGTTIRKNEYTSKPLLALFELFEEYINAWNPEREMQYGLFRVPVPEFSMSAYREGLVNAFCHRDYTILQSVRVIIEDEGLTISSPGGFVQGVNFSNLLTVEPHGRNQVLADALKRIGLAERTGRGIDRIFEGSIIYGRPLPDYSETTSAYVKLFIPRAKPDLPFTKFISDGEKRIGRSLPISSLLILSALQRCERMTLQEISSAANISEIKAKANLDTLLESNFLETSQEKRVTYYTINYGTKSTKKRTAESILHDPAVSENIIMDFVRQNASKITKNEAAKLLGVTLQQAYRILKKLTENGRLRLEGAGRTAHYAEIKE